MGIGVLVEMNIDVMVDTDEFVEEEVVADSFLQTGCFL